MVVYMNTLTMSEMPFALFLLGAFWALENLVRAESPGRLRQFLVGMLLAVPFLSRTAGALIVPAGLVVLHWAGRRVMWTAVGAALMAAPWVIWTKLSWGMYQADGVEGYYTDYTGWWASFGLPELRRVLVQNLLAITAEIGALPLGGGGYFATKSGLGMIWLALALILGLIGVSAMVRGVKQGRVAVCCIGAYLALILVWPWPPERFLIPIMPILAVLWLGGLANWLRTRWSETTSRRLAGGFVALGLVLNFTLLASELRAREKTGFPYITKLDSPAVAWSSYETMFAWLRVHSKPDDVIAGPMAPMLYLYSDRPAYRPYVIAPPAMFYGESGPPLGTPEMLFQNLEQRSPRYLVHCPMPGWPDEDAYANLVAALRTAHADCLREVYVGADPRFVVYEVQRDRVVALHDSGDGQ
jgi:hypothetical protein